MTLADLDKAFIELWKHPNQLPTLLEKWQEMIGDYLAGVEQTEAFKTDYEAYLVKWQSILDRNRMLLETEQQNLKAKLKTGEMKVEPSVIAKKFQSQ